MALPPSDSHPGTIAPTQLSPYVCPPHCHPVFRFFSLFRILFPQSVILGHVLSFPDIQWSSLLLPSPSHNHLAFIPHILSGVAQPGVPLWLLFGVDIGEYGSGIVAAPFGIPGSCSGRAWPCLWGGSCRTRPCPLVTFFARQSSGPKLDSEPEGWNFQFLGIVLGYGPQKIPGQAEESDSTGVGV